MLMVVGTASSVGKSVLVTALCRIFAQDAIRVAPFKAQNMSNNAAVTPDGLEIGRAQAEQAAAAGLEPEVAMNPILLKPQGDRTSHVILDGRPAGVLTSADFIRRKRDFWPHVERALHSLRERYDLVVVEGAGSPAEPNLQATDIVNMRVARHAGAVTLLVGDIDRGGVFAHFLGTLELLAPEDRVLLQGLVVNRFRGDPALLSPAIEVIERRTGVPVLGVIPWLDDLGVADEDAVALERHREAQDRPAPNVDAVVDIAAIQLPHIANFDDLDPLKAEPGVRVRWVRTTAELKTPDLIVLPGTRATIADLEWLRAAGLAEAITARVDVGAHVLGICGGYQMLGERLIDIEGIEAPAGTAALGLGLLPLETEFHAAKQTRRTSGRMLFAPGIWSGASGLPIAGYEIHMGTSRPTEGNASPGLMDVDGRIDGAVSPDGGAAGTYLHGLFHNDALRAELLRALGRSESSTASAAAREAAFDRLATSVREHLDLARIRQLLGV
ncbi:MAG: cobyric acid synthase [Chloroflexota bacterium]